MFLRGALGLDSGEIAALCKVILQRSQGESRRQTHNVGGWRSDVDFLNWPEIESTRLRELLISRLTELTAEPVAEIRAWALVNRKGAFHRTHRHGERFNWTGIYYLDPGGVPSARTCFHPSNGELIYVAPIVDQVVLFKADLQHSVEVHKGLGERITIAFDSTT